jgi:hypothetical protein
MAGICGNMSNNLDFSNIYGVHLHEKKILRLYHLLRSGSLSGSDQKDLDLAGSASGPLINGLKPSGIWTRGQDSVA